MQLLNWPMKLMKRLRNERASRHANEMLRAIIEAAPVAIIGLDSNGYVHSVWNRAAEKMLGWNEDDVMGRPMPGVPEDQKEEIRKLHEQICSGRAQKGVDIHGQRRDGTPIDYSIYASPLNDPEGSTIGKIAVLLDITERKQAEAVLAAREYEFRTLAENLPDNIVRYDRLGRIVYVNPVLEKNLGATASTLIGTYVGTHGPGGGYEEYRKAVSAALARGEDNEFEYKITVSNGEPAVHQIRLIVERDVNGETTGVLAVGRDITERKQAEASIRKLSQAIEQSPVSIIITDVKGTIEFVNAKFVQITGYSPAEVLGRKPSILKSGETTADVYRHLWNTIGSGGVWCGEIHNRKKNGELFWERVTIAPVRDINNVIVHYVAVKEDITKYKSLEAQYRQVQKMEAIGQLAGGVAHDFNNMLGVILGHAELGLEEVDSSQSIFNNLQEIKIAAERSADLTRQLLAFARKQTIVPVVLDLNETIAGMLKMLRRLIGADIDLAWMPGLRVWPIKVDPSQVDQILANLCVNARDAITGTGRIIIETKNVTIDREHCTGHPGFVPGEFAQLTVSDDGCGMDEKTQNKIFEPFFTTKEIGRGTGLGLATVYGIIKQNKGFIYVYSEVGNGTTFKIYLPRHVAETGDDLNKNRQQPARGGHETILLVEDELSILSLTKDMLERMGYNVLTASTPDEALQSSMDCDGQIHLLLTDLIMPGLNGRELADRLVSLYPDILCLYMSGYTDNVIGHQSVLEEGMHFIQKPFSKQALAAKVRKVLDGY